MAPTESCVRPAREDQLARVTDPNRLAALRRMALLDSPAEPAFDRLTHLAATILHTPVALVSLVDVDRQFFKSCVGLPEPIASLRYLPLSHAFCQHVVAAGAPLRIEDARCHPLVHDHPAVAEFGVIAYLGVPLTTADGHTLGSLCVMDTQPRAWTARDLALLQDLAAATMTEIELRSEVRERRNVEHALHQATQRLSNSLESITDAFFALDDQWRFTYLNHHAEQIFQRAPAVLLGQRIWDAFPNLIDTPFGRAYQNVITTQVATVFEAFYSPCAAWFEVHAYPTGDGLSVYFRDISARKQADDALRFQARLLDTVEQAVVATDPIGTIVYWNRFAETLYGWSAAEMCGRTLLDLMAPNVAQTDVSAAIADLANGMSKAGEVHVRRKDGTVFLALATASPICDDQGAVMGIISVSQDITARKRMEDALRDSEARFRQLAEHITQVFWLADAHRAHLLYVSPAHTELYGRELPSPPIPIEPLMQMIHPEDREWVLAELAAQPQAAYDQEYRILRGDGVIRWVRTRGFPIPDPTGTVYRIAGITEDVTTRKHTEAQLQQLALYDPLTALPNRSLAIDRVEQALVRARRDRTYRCAVLFLDLDRFKVVNDSLGHTVGDQLLVAVAHRLAACVRTSDTVARLGGDEFVLVLDAIKDVSEAIHLADRIQAALRAPFMVGAHEIVITTSIGIALSTTDYTRADEIVRDADTAMYRAKTAGKARYAVFDASMHLQAVTLLQLEAELRRAVDHEELVLHYQPVLNIASGTIIGVEALVRWQHPERGLLSPMEFIALAEETGLIVPLGSWVLRTACGHVRAWQAAGVPLQWVSVNLSARQFRQPRLATMIATTLAETGLEPQCLKLELTESSVMEHAEATIATLEAVKALGVQFAIDDFGTGYSSLAYLKRFPLDTLKIAYPFVHEITTNANDAAITRAIIMMAHTLGLDVIAEGVETPEQFALLASYGCDAVQGYLVSHPRPPDALMTHWGRDSKAYR